MDLPSSALVGSAVGIVASFFASGAAALVLQVLWARMLGHVLGASALAVATVLTVFMAGLALGSHLAGRWIDHVTRPFLVFALLEAGVGLYGLGVPFVLEGVFDLQRIMGADLGRWGYALFRFGVCAVILLPPTLAMGATLPVLARALIRHRGSAGVEVGRLYAANTAGAVAGAVAAGFWLIPSYGVEHTVRVAASMDIGVALFVGLLGRWLKPPSAQREPNDARLLRLSGVDLEEERPTPGDLRWALLTYGLTGAASMGLEVLWSRAVGVVIGSSTYGFTLILAAYLTGLAVGAAVATRALPYVRRSLSAIRALVFVAGIGTILATLVVDRLPLWLQSAAVGADVSHADVFWRCFIITLTVTLPATLPFGAMMPLAIKVMSRARELDPAAAVGKAYAINTVGAIVGSFAGGFIILPLLGVEVGIKAIGGALVVFAAFGRSAPVRLRAAAVVALAIAVVAPRWNYDRWTAGLFRMYLARSVFADGWTTQAEVLFHADGVASSVTVDRMNTSGNITLKVNGKVDASDHGDMPTQILSGLLPALLHPGPKEALVIGYGSGVTPGALLQTQIDRVVVAEVESEVYRASNRYFAHVNHTPHLDPRAELVVDDGRNYLLIRREDFDLVISEPSNPWMSGASSLFTQDFFRIVKDRLRPGGMFLQWVQLYELSPSNVNTILRTFHSVFPYVMVFSPDPSSNDLFLIGALQPPAPSLRRFQEPTPAVQAELLRAGIERSTDVLGLLIGSEQDIEERVPPGVLNTDDLPVIEFSAPLDLLTYSTRDPVIPFVYGAEGRLFDRAHELFTDLPRDAAFRDEVAWSLVRQGRLADARHFARAARDDDPKLGMDALRVLRLLEEMDGETVVVVDEHTRDDREYAEAVWHMTEGNDRLALTIVERAMFEERGPAHRFLYAFLCYREGRHTDAEYLFDSVLDDDVFVARHPTVLYYAGRNMVYRRDLEEALDLLLRFDLARASERG